jgi:hypothetical protein
MPITDKQFRASAKVLGVEVAAIKAVAKVEGGGTGIIAGKPVILFEPHIFYKLQRQAGIKPVISKICYPIWKTYPYPKGQQAQWDRMDQASKINRSIALQSASWGLFQIMGYHFKTTGCKTLQQFINAMHESEDKHLELFVNYINNSNLDDELRLKDWKGFARQYNGALYYKNAYDTKLKKAYESFS